jgi:hypothetical protein
VYILDKGAINIPGRTKQDGEQSHHTTQNGTQFESYEWFSSRILHLMFLQVMEIENAKLWIKGDYCSIL